MAGNNVVSSSTAAREPLPATAGTAAVGVSETEKRRLSLKSNSGFVESIKITV